MATIETTTTAIEPVPCPKCGPRGDVRAEWLWGEWSVCCGNCYDVDCVGDPPREVSSSLTGCGRTRAAAIADWNATVAEELS